MSTTAVLPTQIQSIPGHLWQQVDQGNSLFFMRKELIDAFGMTNGLISYYVNRGYLHAIDVGRQQRIVHPHKDVLDILNNALGSVLDARDIMRVLRMRRLHATSLHAMGGFFVPGEGWHILKETFIDYIHAHMCGYLGPDYG